ncbi:hypothetical protein AciM339_0221 [Aciduliprofundum sp. MAR08-339]|uniref:hypothetical protein n=1 Tax=Aciduliprofundum sp. (strain MAR08-339) TaxID=673860 RepID=UPI0002A4BAFB|nr:hypothetical protein AciM339_0189 [Aciduliprofundum sp. MAR08-339]AGB04118.1 hypothetical protein AciM339_0221 [Aciduliprofundum sp. MAR08-339]
MAEDVEIEKIVNAVLRAIEEKEKRKEEDERKRAKYIKKIWKYFPGAKTKGISTEELREMSEKLDEFAKKVGYIPAKSTEVKTSFFGENKKRKIAIIMILIVAIIGAAISKLFMGW